MSIRKQQKDRPNYEDLGLTMESVKKVADCCTAGVFDMETMQRACRGFEWIQQFIILSATKKLSYDRLEFNTKWGQIPVGRSNFYMFRRRFYANLCKELSCREGGEVIDSRRGGITDNIF